MLIQFDFKNFKSFQEEAALDLSATEETELSEQVVSIANEKILPVAALYGANASGKSNVYQAFRYMSNYVVKSFQYGDEKEEYDRHKPIPFLLDSASEKEESCFEVYFTLPGDLSQKIYQYGFCVDGGGVTEEWLNTKARTVKKYKKIFYRSVRENKLDLSGLPAKSRENIRTALEGQALIVSLGTKLKIEICKTVRDWFAGNAFADFGDPITDVCLSRLLPHNFANDEKVQKNVVKYFSSFDNQIKGFQIERVQRTDQVGKINREDENPNEYYKIDALHDKIDSDEKARIPFSQESAGTLKMFSLYPGLLNVLQSGSIFFIDELNARLHPLLVRDFLLLFLNPEINTQHAQLIFTVHDTWLLSEKLLRRDEVWFVEKDDKGRSTLYSLADFEDKEKEDYGREKDWEEDYLLGKFGAVPTLRNLDVLGGA